MCRVVQQLSQAFLAQDGTPISKGGSEKPIGARLVALSRGADDCQRR
jgi:hypothetical protein